jgi:beta-glucosidase
MHKTFARREQLMLKRQYCTRKVGIAVLSAILIISPCAQTAVMAQTTNSGAVAAADTGTAKAAISSSTTTFPGVYTNDYLKPMTDQSQINKIVGALIDVMTEDEKYMFLGGTGTGNLGNAGDIVGVPRLGIPEVLSYDGPAGLYWLYSTTNPPQEELLASTFSEEDAKTYGEIYNTENKAMGGGEMLSAELDIQRVPQFGRTKDQMGEDPYLLSSLADDLVQGMQEGGGMATLKHFAAFAEDATPAHKSDILVSEQALHETYLPGFESAIKDGGAVSVMSSYNAINGDYASASDYLQNTVLREYWNFDGFTMTDWGGNHELTLGLGTDQEMPSLTKNKKENVDQAVADGTLSADAVDTAVKHILTAYAKAGYLSLVQLDADGNVISEPGRTKDNPILAYQSKEDMEAVADENNAKSEQVALDGEVLLKNEGALPLAEDKTVAVIGLGGSHLISGWGGERSYGNITYMTSPADALKDILGSDKVEAQTANDIIGTVIPAENYYTTLDGTEHGISRTYGVTKSEGQSEEQQGQMFRSGDVTAKDMEGHETGSLAQVDQTIDFTTGTVDGKPNTTYFNSADGTALSNAKGEAYTWTTYLEAPEDGEYTLCFNTIGGGAALKVYDESTGTEEQIASASSSTSRQGVSWYDSLVPTATGQSVSNATVTLTKGQRYKVEIKGNADMTNKDLQISLNWITPSQKTEAYNDAIQAAGKNDTSVVFVYSESDSEGSTRHEDTLKLSDDQEKLINDVAAAAHANNHKVVVVLQNSAAVTMQNWIDNVDGLLAMQYAGQAGGTATAKLLTGEVNPSGKTAYTYPKQVEDTIICYSDENWENNKKEVTDDAGAAAPSDNSFGFSTVDTVSDYSEGILTGYKWYDSKDIDVQYDFGYGLSYTTFQYSNLSVKPAAEEDEETGLDVTFTVTNTGDTAGTEVAQIYLGEANVPEGIQTAERTLSGYQRVEDLQPGESRSVTIHVSQRALSYWNSNTDQLNVRADGTKDKWTVAEGSRMVYVGGSSDELPLSASTEVKESLTTSDDNAFEDVTDETKYFYNPVYWAKANGITEGVSDTLFGVGQTVTRAQMIQWLWKAAGSPKAQSSDNPFKDVKEDAFYREAVLWAAENKITAGTSDGVFSPDAPCTRAQIITFLYLAEGADAAKTSSSFTDVSDTAFYRNAVNWAVANKVTAGIDDTHFGPDQPCTREQAVTFLNKVYAE